jgi:hypothetical protein
LNSCSGGVRNWTRTSVNFCGMRLPWRSRIGTPAQRQLSISARIATKVSVLEPAGTPFSSR